MQSNFFKHIFKLGKNDLVLTQEFNFNEFDSEYINRTFWPIVDIHSYNISEIEEFLLQSKNEFTNRNDSFDFNIFKRNEIDLELPYLETYLECLEKIKYKSWVVPKGKYFYHLKLENERGTNAHTLLISDKNEVQLEIYFKDILQVLSSFLEENKPKIKIEVLKELADKIEINSFFAIQKSNERTIKRLTKKIELQETNEDKIAYCKLKIKDFKQAEIEVNLNLMEIHDPYDSLHEEVYSKHPDRTKILENWLKTEIEHLESLSKREEVEKSTKPTKENPPTEMLKDLITHSLSKEIVDSIKIRYKNISGKQLKLLLLALQQTELIPNERIASKFHRCCKNEFQWDIASYTAMNDYHYNVNIDKEELNGIKSFLDNQKNNK